MKLQTDTEVLSVTATPDAVSYAAGDIVGTTASPFWLFGDATARFNGSAAVLRGAAIVDGGAGSENFTLHFYKGSPVIGGGSVSPGDAWGLTLADAPNYFGSLALGAAAEVGDAGVADCTYADADADPPVILSLNADADLYVVVEAEDALNWSGGASAVTISLTLERW